MTSATFATPSSVTSIGDNAFSGCTALESLTVPPTVEEIGENAFYGVPSVTYYGSATGSWGAQATNTNANDFQFEDAERTILIGYSGSGGDVYIPNTVKTIGDNAFQGHTDIESVHIPNSVTSIRDYAFASCYNLESVTLGNSVNIIGKQAFGFCSSLSSIDIPESVKTIGNEAFCFCNNLQSVTVGNSVESIGKSAFTNCSAITSITIPESVQNIGDNAFYGCNNIKTLNYNTNALDLSSINKSNLETVVIGDAVTTIPFHAFINCSNLKSITIGNSVENIGKSAFYCCSSLESIVIPESVTTIGDGAFIGCNLRSFTINSDADFSNAELYFTQDGFGFHVLNKNDVEVVKNYVDGSNSYSGEVVIPETVGDFAVIGIGHGAFFYCNSLSSITIPESVTYIGHNAFEGCSSLTSVTIPNSVTNIEYGTFWSCSSLSSITIPEAVTNISGSAFSGCANLTEINVKSGNSNYTSDNGILFNKDKTTITRYPTGKTETTYTIPSSVTSIGDDAFDGCSGLSEVNIPNSVTSIGNSAFYYCSDLTEVTIPNSVTIIGNDAFTGVKKIVNHSNVTAGSPWGADEVVNDPDFILSEDGKTLIKYNGEGGDVVIPDGVEAIGEGAFQNCSTITSLGIPNSVETIGKLAFDDCSGLTSVSINSDADFSNAGLYFTQNGIRYHVLNKDKVEVVQNFVDGSTSYSGNVEIPKTVGDFTVTAIGNNAFRDCDNLTSISFPEGLETIGDWAFADCDGLTTVDIPSSVTQLGSYDYAFVGCSNLKAINVKDGNQNYSSVDGVLYNKNQTKIISYPAGKTGTTYEIPASVTEVGWHAFSGCNKLESVTIPEDIVYFGGYAFENCSNLESVNIPENIEIHDGTFAGCENLTLTIPETVTFFEGPYPQNNWFQGVKKVIYAGTVNRGQYGAEEAVAEFVLDGSKLVRYNGQGGTVSIPEGVTAIGNGVFLENSDITAVYIPEGIETIGDAAFASCGNLQYVNIPKTVTSISGYAFRDCDKLPSINVAAENPNFTSVDGVLFSNDKKTLVCYPAGKTGTTYVIPDGVETINWCAFACCDNLKSVTIPEGVKKIWGWAFENCTGLTEITIPSTVETIGSKAFMDCSNLSKVILLSENTTYEDDAFEGIELPTIEYKNPNNEEEYLTYEVRNGAAVVTGYKSNIPENLTIPSTVTIDGVEYEVTSIGDQAFNNCSGLTSVTIPNSVTTISYCAFENCNSLTSVQIPNTVDNIGSYAFYNSGLTSIEIPESVKYIGVGAFGICSSLESIVIPNSVDSIGNYAFYLCNGLSSLEIPESVKHIGDYAFLSCDNIKNLSYNTDAFNPSNINKSNLETVVIGDAVTSIPNDAFRGCSKLASVSFGNSIKSIGNYAFNNCAFTSVTIPNSAESIGDYAFNACPNLISMEIPASVKQIGDDAFLSDIKTLSYNTDAFDPRSIFRSVLETINIGNAVTKVSDGAFNGFDKLTSVSIESDADFSKAELYFTHDGIRYHVLSKNEVEVVSNYIDNTNSYSGNLVILETVGDFAVTGIEDYAFYNCDGLTSIVIPESVKTIGDYAFAYCDNIKTLTYNTDALNINSISKSNLETVVIGDAITSIPDDAYFDCENLKSVTIGKSVESIGSRAFQNTGLESVAIPESVTSISSYAFNNCDGLTSVTIPESVETVGDYAFANCDNLSELTYNPATTTIGENAFEGTKVNLQQGNEEEEYVLRYEIRDGAVIVSGYNSNIPENLTIPSTVTIDGVEYAVTGIRENAFYGCEKLKSIEISEGIETIGDKAFLGCSNLESITIPSSVSSFGGWDVFEGCEKVKTLTYNTDALDLRYVNKLPLETVVIGESVTKIPNSGFYNWSNLKSITIGKSVETIGSNAFNGCSGLTSIKIPASVKEIGKNAFSNCTGLTSVEIPKTVKTVGDYAFANCSNLANVDYNPSTTTFGKGAFEGTKIESPQGTEEEGYELTYVIRDGAAVVTGYNGTISGDVTIPSTLTINGTKYTVKGIDNNAFSNCTKLTSVTIPNSVESIGSKAFYNCTGLGSLTVPKSVTSIGTDAFKDVNNVVNMSKIPDGQWGAASIFTLRHDTVRMQITETKIEYIHDTIFMFRTVAVNDLSANLSIYPNPTTSFVTVKGERKFSYILANSTGAALRRGDGSDMYVVDLSDYADGIYLLYTSDGELYKIIKE